VTIAQGGARLVGYARDAAQPRDGLHRVDTLSPDRAQHVPSGVPVRAVRLRRVDAGLGRLRSLVAGGLYRHIELHRGSPGLLTLEWGGDIAPDGPFVRIGTRLGAVVLADPSQLMRVLTGLEPAGALAPGPGREIFERVLLGRLSSALWDDLGTCHALSQADGPPAGLVSMRLTVCGRDVRSATVAALAWADVAAWAQWLAGPAWKPVDSAGALARKLSLDMPVVIGRTQLDAGQLRSLEVGDVLPLAHAWFDTSGLGVLGVGGGRAMSVRVDDAGPAPVLRFLGWCRHDASAEQDVAAPGGEIEPMAGPFGSPGIPVTFVSGRLALRVQDLEGLDCDAPLPMREPVTSRVRVLVGERVVALGDLVALAGRLAVELVAVGHGASAAAMTGR
jgi:flagellar motor switch/type III secretory pathway protein FliN